MVRRQFQRGLNHLADAPRGEQADAGLVEQQRPPCVIRRTDRRPSQHAALEFGHRAAADEVATLHGRRGGGRLRQLLEDHLRRSHTDHSAIRDHCRVDQHTIQKGAVAAAEIVQHPRVAGCIKTHGGVRAAGQPICHHDRRLGRAAERVVMRGVEHERGPRAVGDPQHQRRRRRE